MGGGGYDVVEDGAHRDDIGVTHDGVGQSECKDYLEFERCHVTVYRDFLQCV